MFSRLSAQLGCQIHCHSLTIAIPRLTIELEPSRVQVSLANLFADVRRCRIGELGANFCSMVQRLDRETPRLKLGDYGGAWSRRSTARDQILYLAGAVSL